MITPLRSGQVDPHSTETPQAAKTQAATTAAPKPAAKKDNKRKRTVRLPSCVCTPSGRA